MQRSYRSRHEINIAFKKQAKNILTKTLSERSRPVPYIQTFRLNAVYGKKTFAPKEFHIRYTAKKSLNIYNYNLRNKNYHK